MSVSNCIGWWEQTGLGRQEMKDLFVEFGDGSIRGSGRDIVGEFSMTGTLATSGSVRIVKRYAGQHHVVYMGNYDGEGTLFGTWLIELMAGSWSIKLLRGPEAQAADFEEILPMGQAS